MEKICWMFCTQCKRTVVFNRAGICLRCQGLYIAEEQPDSWENMHKCKVCGKDFPFIFEGCLRCQDLDMGEEGDGDVVS